MTPRAPASLTKMMTLYVLFSYLRSGAVTPDTEFVVTPYAASQSPTKLGLKPGATIRAADAVNALVTLSANDAAVTIAENLAGTEGELRQGDDQEGAGDRHDVHALPQRLRPAERPAGDHRARYGHPGAASDSRLPGILRLLPDEIFHLSRPPLPQPQPPPVRLQGHRRHQDRLHQGRRLQPHRLGQARRQAPRGGRARRQDRLPARRRHAVAARQIFPQGRRRQAETCGHSAAGCEPRNRSAATAGRQEARVRPRLRRPGGACELQH